MARDMVSYNHRETLHNKKEEVQDMKKFIITEYEKKQAAADKNLYMAVRVLKKNGVDDKCLEAAKRELRSRLKLEDASDAMEIRVFGKDILDSWQKTKYPGMTEEEAVDKFKRIMYHGDNKTGWHSVKTKWVKQNGVWVSYERFAYTR